jgi:hypothetical protein
MSVIYAAFMGSFYFHGRMTGIYEIFSSCLPIQVAGKRETSPFWRWQWPRRLPMPAATVDQRNTDAKDCKRHYKNHDLSNSLKRRDIYDVGNEIKFEIFAEVKIWISFFCALHPKCVRTFCMFFIIVETFFFLNGSTALVGPRLFLSFLIYSIHNRQDCLNEWSAHRKASTETLDGKRPIISLRLLHLFPSPLYQTANDILDRRTTSILSENNFCLSPSWDSLWLTERFVYSLTALVCTAVTRR